MTERLARYYLASQLQYQLIKDRYDEDELFRFCILTLMPDFEYPDWSHRTISEFLRKTE